MHQIHNGDCAEVMASMGDNSVDAIVTDPPYGLSFMGKEWDSFGTDTRQPGDEHYTRVDNPYGRGKVRYGYGSKLRDSMEMFQLAMTPIFEEALRVAKPGAHLLCFGGTRTFHRMACAIEDAGWEIRDCIMWVYGSGFPKSMDVSKAIDKALGKKREKVPNPLAKQQTSYHTDVYSGQGDRDFKQPIPATDAGAQWDGWGTCLKPAWEPIIVARKPLDGTVAHNVLTWGTGALNIDACRVPIEQGDDVFAKNPHTRSKGKDSGIYGAYGAAESNWSGAKGRFPANLVHDGSQMVLELFPETQRADGHRTDLGGSAARFFYCAKASKKERGEGNHHPTIKPIALMKWLITLVTPQGGWCLTRSLAAAPRSWHASSWASTASA